MMHGDILISIVAIVVPFLFAAWVIKTSVRSKERKREDRSTRESDRQMSDRELEMGIMDLAKRIENLEIILRNRHNTNNKE
ncbi:MAG TPA: hypothetical protein VKZ39_03640 [Sphaerochaetaceae bacterium]|jgi:hypothetical protein|nr:hypothetical protein [Sphaerochaetaceae bacterium]